MAPVSVIPYGADDSLPAAPRDAAGLCRGALKVLFVGGLSQRKGIADLFEAADMLGAHVELTVVGRKAAGACAALDSALGEHRWIESLPREKILAQMRPHVFSRKLSPCVQAQRSVLGHGPAQSSLATSLHDRKTDVVWRNTNVQGGVRSINSLKQQSVKRQQWENVRELYFGEVNIRVRLQVLEKIAANAVKTSE